ncbi:MAG: fumarylacetoacetate hydrolase family protein [Thermoplasmatota archaeon]
MVEIKLGILDYSLSPSKIVCLLRNYAEHAREMADEVPIKPSFFLKPPSSLVGENGEIVIPECVEDLHHEVELAVIIGRKGRNIPKDDAMEHVKGFALMLDITARDIQSEAKKKGLPWTEAKGYDTFSPIGPTALPREDFDYRNKRIWLSVNGDMRQDGNTDQMVFTPEHLISAISSVMTLEEDDIIMTGTPAGVGPLEDGDVVEAGIEGLCRMKIGVVSEERFHRYQM